MFEYNENLYSKEIRLTEEKEAKEYIYYSLNNPSINENVRVAFEDTFYYEYEISKEEAAKNAAAQAAAEEAEKNRIDTAAVLRQLLGV